MSEKHLYIRISASEWTYWGNTGHTGDGLVSTCGCLSALVRSPHFLQSISAYTPDLGRLSM